MINKTFSGEILKKLRTEKGLTQTELGERSGLSTRMIVHYEKHIKRPPADKLSAIASALNIKLDDLLNNNISDKMPTADKGFSRKLEKARKLPIDDQKFLGSMIDNLMKKNNLQIKKPRKKHLSMAIK
jgi:transcriptional regulator with XRE-family HTH domain